MVAFKERLRTRIARIQEYKEYASLYRAIKRDTYVAEGHITKLVDANTVDETYACIKQYYTYMPATNTQEIGEGIIPHIKYCHRFDEKQCPIWNCPYYEKNKKYHNAKLFLRQAQIEKRMAFKRIFERIK